MVFHHGAVCCNLMNFTMAIIAVAMPLLITGEIALTSAVSSSLVNLNLTVTSTLDIEIGIWRNCAKASGSNTWNCFNYADGSALPFARVDEDGNYPDIYTLQALYTTAVVLLLVSNCLAFGGYSGQAKMSCLVSSLFASIASIFFLSIAIWVTCRTAVPDMDSSGAVVIGGTTYTGNFELGWNFTYVYMWIGWLLCNGSAGASYKAYKACDESPAEHASHQPETTVGKV